MEPARVFAADVLGLTVVNAGDNPHVMEPPDRRDLHAQNSARRHILFQNDRATAIGNHGNWEIVMVELRGLVAGNEQRGIVTVVGRHQRAGNFQCGLVGGTTAGVDRGGEGTSGANLLLNLPGRRPGRRDVIFGDTGEVDDQVDLFGIDARFGHGEFCRVDGRDQRPSRFLRREGPQCRCLSQSRHWQRKPLRLFFVFEDLRQGLLS